MDDRREATYEERRILSRFGGFGAVALFLFPDPVTGAYKDDGWRELGEELKSLLTPDEYASARRTTFNAFYTSPVVIDAMFEGLERLGVPPDARVLEPGCGRGNFLSRAPESMRFIGVELDSLSGRIARALHPKADVRIESFEDSKLPGNLDAVIGNPPFADVKIAYGGEKLALHDFFIAKSLDALRPGGIVALVTSHFTLDKHNASVREALAGKADFLGAIRLPSDAFKREGTSVVTDILFLRKREPGVEPSHADPEWTKTAPLEIEGKPVAINRYFHDHPEMVLGTWSRRNQLYGGDDGYSVAGDGDLAEQLRAAISRLPRFDALSPHRTDEAAFPPSPSPSLAEGGFFVGPDRVIRRIENGHAVAVKHGATELTATGTMMGKRLAALIELRDLARRVLASQNEGRSEAERDKARKELNRVYDRFAATYGPINTTTFSDTTDGTTVRRMPNVVKFREDPDAMLVLALEQYDELTGKAEKAPILLRDVVGKAPPIIRVDSAEDGLLVSLDRTGKIDAALISELYGKPEEDVIAELGDLIHRDPATGAWETADAYLSGNVREKLAVAEAAGPAFAHNAEALRRVQPEDVLPGEIDANLGAPWIPIEDVQAFACELFGVEPKNVSVAHLKSDALWSVEADFAARQSVANVADYGTTRVDGISLLESALNMKTPVIYDTIAGPNGDERVVNQAETLAAREKQKRIKEAFRGWAFSDPERCERLVRLYNDAYNNLRPRLFDGSHLEFPGMSSSLTLRPHQKDAVWRVMSSGNTLLAHAVGAGKTFTMVAAGMKLKQAGLVKKPMYVVPNHMLEQFSREFMQLYPNARILVATKEDLEKSRRKLLTAKIAGGDWDGVVVTHSSFERIGMSAEFQRRFLTEQIDAYAELLVDHQRASGAKRNMLKTIEKQMARRQQKLKDLLAEDKKDDGLVFDELGVDHIFVDEAHYFKNLETPTKMERVAGIQTGGSERAFDLYLKARYLGERKPGRGVTFATGTPISNSMVEMFTMQRFLDPEGLKERGIDAFDGWAATFGEVVDTMEIAPDGSSLRPRSRFAKFTNLPELTQMFRGFADVRTPEMLDLPRPRLKGDKPTVVACPMSDDQQRLQEGLIERYERIRSSKVDPREDNALAITTDGRKLALDPRLLTAEAADHPEGKINALVANVRSIWEETADRRGTQLIFSDMGVNPTNWGFSPYQEIIKKLIHSGVPRDQIAAIGEADSDAKKQALFDKVRSGAVRILLGSTQKMGTGTNVQRRLVALHHLDAPWKPAEVEQREGRILRQGNENDEVSIYRYVTQGSFDSYMWQALETKARFIGQVMKGETTLRQAEDVGEQELSYAEVKAIASGNPAVLTLAETEAELQRLSVLRKNHGDEQFLARRSVRDLPEEIERRERRLEALEADAAVLAGSDETTIAGRRVAPGDRFGVLGGILDRLPSALFEEATTPIGTHRGLQFGLIRHPQTTPELYFAGRTTRRLSFSGHDPGPRAVLNALDRLASAYPGWVATERRDLEIARSKLRDFQARLGAPFPHEDHLRRLAELRDELKTALSAHASPEHRPAREVADEIKALSAGREIESAPARSTSRRPAGEEPVTARIRRRAETTVEVPASSTVEAEPTTREIPAAPDPRATVIHIQPHGRNHMTETSTSTPTETARLPDEEVSGTEPIAEKRYAADPRPWHTIALSDHNGGPSMELRRSFQFKQMQIAFEGEQPDESHLARLKGAGWTDRTESEGVWTKQVHPGEWKGVHDAERLFVEIANDIRAERGLEAITPLGRAAGA